MPAIAIIGAGPGLGAATARRFGREGFGIALIARTPDKLDRLREELAVHGIEAGGYTADVQDSALPSEPKPPEEAPRVWRPSWWPGLDFLVLVSPPARTERQTMMTAGRRARSR